MTNHPVHHGMHTLFQRPDRLPYPLHVVTPIFNPVRYRSRWRLYEDFEKMVTEAGAILTTVEVAFGDRAFAVTSPDNPRHVQLRTNDELWLKENLINVGVSRLPSDWQRVAWVDADTLFVRDDWANETLHRLQHYAFVQMWSQYQDLNANQELVGGSSTSFMQNFVASGGESVRRGSRTPYYYEPRRGYPGAPGLAWACTRAAWDAIGGLLDTCILGAGDWYMAYALVGRLSEVLGQNNHASYNRRMLEWQERAQAIQKNIGCVPGLAMHYWHGPKASRGYQTRERILIDTQFNPDVDIHRDWQGVYKFRTRDDRTIQLRDRVRQYFHARQEDSI